MQHPKEIDAEEAAINEVYDTAWLAGVRFAIEAMCPMCKWQKPLAGVSHALKDGSPSSCRASEIHEALRAAAGGDVMATDPLDLEQFEGATPGPWHITERFNEPYGYTPTVRVNAERDMSVPEGTVCKVWGAEHDAEANARLIAAAPALLAEVRRLREQYELAEDDNVAYRERNALYSEQNQGLEAEVARLRAALEKIAGAPTGESTDIPRIHLNTCRKIARDALENR